MNSGRVTIQDIADRLGISKFSVSRALSGKSGVGEATRSRVLRAAHSMGYRRSQELPAANGQILFIRQEIDPVSSELWLNMLHGAEREGERLGFSIVPRQARHLAEGGPLDSAVAGLILAVPRPHEISALAARTGLPVVCATYVGAMERIDQVVGADWEAGVGVARLLTGLGHRAVAFVHGSTLPLGRAERFRGFRDGMLETPGTTVEDIVFDEAEGFRDAFLAHLRRGGAPTALFCAHDGIAVNVISDLLRLGLRVPEDISVVGFNDFAAASQVSPRLTTVRTPQVEIGAAMVRCIADRLGDAEAASRPPVRLALVAEIVTRASTGPAAPTTWLAPVLKRAKAAT
ncbi:LacI family DNA-binding transcriptional regulator [Inquilinus limosus]|uniref:LacI family DNA-binding transcriptional regulator n=1 Tax=Inquilinus limosus TaxID=171674 RepID=UPI000418A9E8|nr:LacI family DNA-binding transcriptional regulator [Inquilinus limosus]